MRKPKEDIKADVIKLCNDFAVFWQQLAQEISPLYDDVDVIIKWQDYFEEHDEMTAQFAQVNWNIQDLKDYYIVTGKVGLETVKKIKVC